MKTVKEFPDDDSSHLLLLNSGRDSTLSRKPQRSGNPSSDFFAPAADSPLRRVGIAASNSVSAELPIQRPGAPQAFLNLPFHVRYTELLLAYVAGLSSLGLRPAIITTDRRHFRLEDLRRLIADSVVSLHDMSFLHWKEPRFNMAIELGLALGAAGAQSPGAKHQVAIFESQPYRLLRTASDVNGLDPEIHNGTPEGVIRAVLNRIPQLHASRAVTPSVGLRVFARLHRRYLRYRRDYGPIFGAHCFGRIIADAAFIADEAYFRPGRGVRRDAACAAAPGGPK